jgi:hyperosmotically inducible periplasmic protein
MKSDKTIIKILAVYTFILLIASLAIFSSRLSPGEYADDLTITSKAKANILGDSTLRMFGISVETIQGVVQLSGFVDSSRSEQAAVNHVNHVAGVKSIKDDLIVRGAVK